jgi:hypothetical protein
MNRTRPYRWLALLPALGILIGIPFANRVHAYVVGLPFLLFWIVAWVVITSALMAVIESLDRRRDAEDASRPPKGAPGAADRR